MSTLSETVDTYMSGNIFMKEAIQRGMSYMTYQKKSMNTFRKNLELFYNGIKFLELLDRIFKSA